MRTAGTVLASFAGVDSSTASKALVRARHIDPFHRAHDMLVKRHTAVLADVSTSLATTTLMNPMELTAGSAREALSKNARYNMSDQVRRDAVGLDDW